MCPQGVILQCGLRRSFHLALFQLLLWKLEKLLLSQLLVQDLLLDDAILLALPLIWLG